MLDHAKLLWEFIFEEQPEVRIYFRREGPLWNIQKLKPFEDYQLYGILLWILQYTDDFSPVELIQKCIHSYQPIWLDGMKWFSSEWQQWQHRRELQWHKVIIHDIIGNEIIWYPTHCIYVWTAIRLSHWCMFYSNRGSNAWCKDHTYSKYLFQIL